MSTENLNGTNGTETNGAEPAEKKTPKVFATVAEAKAGRPADATARIKVFAVKDGDGKVVGYTNADTHNIALAAYARAQGFRASLAETEARPEKVASLLDGLSDEDRAEILKAYTKSGKKKEPAAA
jgi:hypothetical protein